MRKLLSVVDCEKLTVQDVWESYRRHVNPGQVELIKSFAFGRDLAERAEGSWIHTKSGRKILDCTGGMGVLNHGHNHPRILEARRRFEELGGMEVHKNFLSPYIAGLSHNLAQLLPGDLNISFFPNSGAESVEGALKMAYKYHSGKRRHVLHSDISFHGRLFGSASVTGSPELHFSFPRIPGADSFAFSDFGSLQKKVNSLRTGEGMSDIFAIIIEPFSASCLRPCSEEFLRGARDICTREDIILIFDEVYTGWAVTGSLFYFMRHEGLVPDIITMSKSFGGGKATIAGYTARTPVFMKAYGSTSDATLHSTTFNGFGEETITAIEAVNIIIEDDYPARARKVYDQLHSGLVALAQKYPQIIKEVRGAGALNGIIVNSEKKLLNALCSAIPAKMFQDKRLMQKVFSGAIMDHLYEKHGVLTYIGFNREIPLVISPMLIATPQEIDYCLESLDATLKKGLLTLCTSFVKNKLLARTPQSAVPPKEGLPLR